MKRVFFAIATLGALLLGGCGDSVNNAPPPAAMTPRTDQTPAKVPSTKEEKIKAIESSSAPEAEKKRAIEAIKSGSL